MNAKAGLKKERSYKEDKTRAFKNVLQSLQSSLKFEKFLILIGKSLKTMAVKCLELVEQVTLALHQNEDVSKALRLEDFSRKASYKYRVL